MKKFTAITAYVKITDDASVMFHVSLNIITVGVIKFTTMKCKNNGNST